MNNRKGFTLVEVLAVVTIIGVLALITIPTVDSIIKSSKEEAYKDQKDLIISAAKNWATENVFRLPTEESYYEIVTLGELKLGGFIPVDVKNPVNDKCISNDTEIVVMRKGNGYIYTFKNESAIEFTDSCEVLDEEP